MKYVLVAFTLCLSLNALILTPVAEQHADGSGCGCGKGKGGGK